MYEVMLINSDEEVIINAVSTSQDAPRVTGTIKQGINCFNSFTFTIYPNNPGYKKIYPYKSKITVYNTLTGRYEFIGRVLTPSASMDEEGVAYKEYVCESELAYLCDSQQRYKEYHCTPREYLEALIDVHNSSVEVEKQFIVGNVTVTDPNDSIYRYSDYKSTWENIKEDLLDTLGGELHIRHENGIRYLDYLASSGETCSTRIKLGHNMKSASEKLDIGIYTRIIPLGAKIKTTDENGNEVETDERLTIASVNNGIDYLDYQDGINQYGIIQGTVIWDDVTTASELFKKAQEYINSLTISLSNEITAYDLSLIGLDIDSFEVGNYYPIENELLNINYKLRVIQKNIKIENPAESTLTFGTQMIDIKTYNALKRQETQKNLETAIKKLKEIQNSIGVIASEKVNAYDEVLNQTALLQKLVDGNYDGLYLDENGRLFIKGTYVATGILSSTRLKTGSTTEPISWLNLDDGTFSFAGGNMAFDGDNLSIKLGGLNNANGQIKVYDENGELIGSIDKTGFEYAVEGKIVAPAVSTETLCGTDIYCGYKPSDPSKITPNTIAEKLAAVLFKADNANNEVISKVSKGDYETFVRQTAEAISQKVSKGDVISEINQSAEEVRIAANKISLLGFTQINDFTIDTNGKVTMNGDIHARNFSVDDNIYIVDSGTVHSGILWCKNVNEFDQDTMPFIWGDCEEPNLDLRAGPTDLLMDSKGAQLAYRPTDSVLLADKNSSYIKYKDRRITLNDHGITIGDGSWSSQGYTSIYGFDTLKFSAYNVNAAAEMYLFVAENDSALYPMASRPCYLGRTANKWEALFANTGTIITSDREKKHDINYDMSPYEALLPLLKPCHYKMNDGTSNRTHLGFIAQDLEQSLQDIDMGSVDLAAFIKAPRFVKDEEGNDTDVLDGYDYAIRYEELIALNTHMIQKLMNKINELEARLNGQTSIDTD